ncbi:MAG: thiamine biosynthesis protein ThiF [Gammaproteobacteria bacterium HGW-Gammaproteobacteria-13]|nr:MAG: thiamine biosynthesis protein ThiF [Gammaproteobacteria bacterium HGW-Gammaproteobacteria-13]
MRVGPTLVLTDALHKRLQAHLLPGDGLEAAAILLCTRMDVGQLKLLCKDAVLVPHDKCNRVEDYLDWPGDYLEEALDRAEDEDLSLILIHSHPGGFYEFSRTDNDSDQKVIPSLFKNREPRHPGSTVHGSAIIIPGGAIKARLYNESMRPFAVELVAIYGDDFHLYWHDIDQPTHRPMAFTAGMRQELGRLTAAVIGYSGTGSLTAEQITRMGIGNLIVVDFDRVEDRNLNRILNSTTADAQAASLKVDVFQRAAAAYRLDLEAHCIPQTIASREAVLAVARADILFCCVDSHEGRFICDAMAAAFMQPLFDVGVVIPVRTTEFGQSVIMDINGRVDYVQPGGTTLFERGVYTPASLRAEELAKRDPAAYAEQVKAGYMPGSVEEAPSVISVNMLAASTCMQEFIARLYRYRLVSNREHARTVFSLGDNEYDYFPDNAFAHEESALLASGLREPLLGIPFLGAVR